MDHEEEGLPTRRNGEIGKLTGTEKSTEILKEKYLQKVCLKAARERKDHAGRISNLPEAGSKTGPQGRAAEMDKRHNLRPPESSEVSEQSLWAWAGGLSFVSGRDNPTPSKSVFRSM